MQDASTGWPEAPKGSLGEVARLFLKLGLIAFGGPAAHIALMRREVVERRAWLTNQRFLDLFGACNLIPGPSSTELAIMIGYSQAGWPALILAGTLFIAPAMAIVLAFAWGYRQFGGLPAVGWLLYGVKPVIIAVVAQALYGLARTALKGPVLVLAAVSVLAGYFRGFNVIALLFGAAILAMPAKRAPALGYRRSAALLVTGTATSLVGPSAAAAVPVSLPVLFLTFLKIGAVVYGSGYVLLAFLRADFVQHLHWLSDRQLVDAVAVGQFTPGPVFTTATFLGYLFAGLPGAALATLAVFLPSFLLVAAVYPLTERLRRSAWFSAFLDGANAAALGLMAAVTVELARASIVDVPTLLLALLALAVLLRFRPNSAWLVLAGGLSGVGIRLLRG